MYSFFKLRRSCFCIRHCVCIVESIIDVNTRYIIEKKLQLNSNFFQAEIIYFTALHKESPWCYIARSLVSVLVFLEIVLSFFLFASVFYVLILFTYLHYLFGTTNVSSNFSQINIASTDRRISFWIIESSLNLYIRPHP